MDTSQCCNADVQVRSSPLSIKTKAHVLVCSSCQLNLRIVYGGVVHKTGEFLSDASVPPGCHWLQVTSPRHEAIHFVLSQLIYRPDSSKGEVAYDLLDPCDSVKLLWCERIVAGFYTVKPQGPIGQMYSELGRSGIPTLDTAFILPSHRRLGFGLSMLQDFVTSYPNTDLGFSYPISIAMWHVLRRFLEANEELKRKFWLIKDNCEEGNRTLIWLCLKRNIRQVTQH